MLHILTVHWKDDRWVDIQLNYFQQNINIPYKVYAFLNSLPRDHRSKFFYSSIEPITSHPIKLNLLADMACLHSTHDDDWLMFIDGDAFPIGDIVSFASENLRKYPLLAIQRKENEGDKQPHPSFCITTAKFWKEINGDWKAGYKWRNADGDMVTDVGGNLLGKLEEKEIEWLPLLRSNRREIHKICFGIYGDLIYHHGAAFREPVTRIEFQDRKFFPSLKINNRLLKKPYQYARKMEKKFLAITIIRKVIKKNRNLAENVYQSILSDTNFYRYFQKAADE